MNTNRITTINNGKVRKYEASLRKLKDQLAKAEEELLSLRENSIGARNKQSQITKIKADIEKKEDAIRILKGGISIGIDKSGNENLVIKI
ncbi:MAG: hypothetical protein KAI57_04050 [Candidatus Pacebacteria bacterium]|nr:hypothetical protein [Candidatus Paceibacterota bacterium]